MNPRNENTVVNTLSNTNTNIALLTNLSEFKEELREEMKQFQEIVTSQVLLKNKLLTIQNQQLMQQVAQLNKKSMLIEAENNFQIVIETIKELEKLENKIEELKEEIKYRTKKKYKTIAWKIAAAVGLVILAVATYYLWGLVVALPFVIKLFGTLSIWLLVTPILKMVMIDCVWYGIKEAALFMWRATLKNKLTALWYKIYPKSTKAEVEKKVPDAFSMEDKSNQEKNIYAKEKLAETENDVLKLKENLEEIAKTYIYKLNSDSNKWIEFWGIVNKADFRNANAAKILATMQHIKSSTMFDIANESLSQPENVEFSIDSNNLVHGIQPIPDYNVAAATINNTVAPAKIDADANILTYKF